MNRRLVGPLTLAAVLVVALIGLGIWQIERRTWKLALIAQVDRRIHAAATPAPGPTAWPRIVPADAYTHVRVAGRFAGPDTRVQAVTELGAGYWVLTRIDDARGFAVLVNRGFVEGARSLVPRADGVVQVTGLLRLSEPGGGFLRHNDPAAGRWYSRDVAAIAATQRLGRVAPYFIDADAVPTPPTGSPVGGLTVVSFPNNHLVYALTWFTLAAMVVGMAVILVRRTDPLNGANRA